MNLLDLDSQARFDAAVQHHQAGRLAEAEALYRHVLAREARHADSLHLLGLVEHQRGRSATAVDLIHQAIAAAPDTLAYLMNLGIVLRQSGRPEEAEATYRQVLALQPDHALAMGYLGNTLRDQGRADEAVETYRRALQLNPGDADSHHNLGMTLDRLGRTDEAIASYRRALALQPGNANAYNDLGVAYSKQQEHEAAITAFRQALAINPGLPEAQAYLGFLLEGMEQLDEAIEHYRAALALKPDQSETANRLSLILLKQWRLRDALDLYDDLLARGPGEAWPHNDRGALLRELGRPAEAMADFERALEIDPTFAHAHANRGHSLFEQGHHAAAIESFDAALRLSPGRGLALGGRLEAKLQLARWNGLETDIAQVAAEIRAGKQVVSPLVLMCVEDDPALQRKAAAIQARNLIQGDAKPRRIAADGRIRLGYFSPDFRDHPVSKLSFGVFEAHDRSQFEVTAFSLLQAADDPDRERIRRSVDYFVDVSALTTQQLRAEVEARRIDIAIDLAGYTNRARPDVFAARCAPLQVNFLGYPGTVGASFLDYVVADRTVIDSQNAEDFAEKIVFMPHSYGVTSYGGFTLERPDPVAMKAASGLPADAVVFCCFNNIVKINPSVFESWMRIMRAVEAGVLWLSRGSDEVVDNLRREARARGVDPERLVFAERVPSFATHMARYRAADLFLDTWPYNAHTTAADALWMGVPVLTQRGRSFACRVAASFLTAVGLPELITTTPAEYEALAIRMATDPSALAATKRKLEQARLNAPLFDTALYARHLEEAYRQMVVRRKAGQAPDHIDLSPWASGGRPQ